jgi:glycosyltransferase involved in cell wall biosynthesis
MKTDSPLISCLMVTGAGPERAPWFTVALQGYCRQSYPHTEMVIVLDQPATEDRARIERQVAELGRSDIRIICPPGKLPLGALRNLSMDAASGELVCLWDDDDVHHPHRVERQLAHLRATGADAVLLADCLHLFMQQGQCFWVNWQRTRYGGLPGTLLARRDHGLRYPEEGRYAKAGEDTDLLQRLATTSRIEYLKAPPFLYIYRFHGANTWQLDHHAMLAGRFCEPRERLLEHQPALLSSLRGLDLGVSQLLLADQKGLAYGVRLHRNETTDSVPTPP